MNTPKDSSTPSGGKNGARAWKIGITGHRRLTDAAGWRWVEEAVSRELAARTPPWMAVTCLAIGADQLLAELIVRAGGQIHAVLPFADYARTFLPRELATYRRLLAVANVEVLQAARTDDDAYLAAGERVVALADELFAVWDGLPSRGKGGTADIVARAFQTRVAVTQFNPVSFQIIPARAAFGIQPPV